MEYIELWDAALLTYLMDPTGNPRILLLFWKRKPMWSGYIGRSCVRVGRSRADRTLALDRTCVRLIWQNENKRMGIYIERLGAID
jgi:hypothetical protein